MGSGLVTGVAISVFDTERSTAYLLPYLLAGVLIVRRDLPQRHFMLLIAGVAFFNLLHSSPVSLPEQLFRMLNGRSLGDILRDPI